MSDVQLYKIFLRKSSVYFVCDKVNVCVEGESDSEVNPKVLIGYCRCQLLVV